jgi:ferrous iron transport protein A
VPEELTLAHFKVGQLGTIIRIEADIDLKHRMAALGLRETCQVLVLRKASLGGPLHVRVGTTEVIMRRSEAQRIGALPCAS